MKWEAPNFDESEFFPTPPENHTWEITQSHGLISLRPKAIRKQWKLFNYFVFYLEPDFHTYEHEFAVTYVESFSLDWAIINANEIMNRVKYDIRQQKANAKARERAKGDLDKVKAMINGDDLR